MAEIDTQLVYAVDRENEAAWTAFMKILEARPRPGSVIPLSRDEFEAIKSGAMVLALPADYLRGADPTSAEGS